MWRATIVLATVCALAGCGGGTDLSEGDQELAAEFWANINEFERDALCEEMDTASGRADGARVIEEAIEERELADGADALGELGDDATDEERLETLIGPATVEANQARADRAVEIVKYLQEQC